MDDDGASLHATMAFLREFDGALDAIERDATSTAPPPAPCLKPQPTKTTKQDRKNSPILSTAASTTPKTKKEELEFLRAHVQELQEKLRRLKPSSASAAILASARSSHGSSGQPLGGDWTRSDVRAQPVVYTLDEANDNSGAAPPRRIASMWKELAARQYLQRQRAEMENLKLKSMLEDQLKLAKSLQRMLQRHAHSELMPAPNHRKRPRSNSGVKQEQQSESEVFEELSSTVMDMYRNVDAAFADQRFASPDAEVFRDIKAYQDIEKGTSIQVLSAVTLPFDVNTVAQAVWNYFVNESMAAQGFHLERDIEVTEHTVIKSLRVEMQVQRYFGSFRGKIVGRRFVETDRVVILWAILVEPIEVSDAAMDGITMKQQGWTIIRKPEAFAKDPMPVAAIHTKHVSTPIVYGDAYDNHRKLQILLHYVASMLASQSETGQQIVENLLLESGQRSHENVPALVEASP